MYTNPSLQESKTCSSFQTEAFLRKMLPCFFFDFEACILLFQEYIQLLSTITGPHIRMYTHMHMHMHTHPHPHTSLHMLQVSIKNFVQLLTASFTHQFTLHVLLNTHCIYTHADVTYLPEGKEQMGFVLYNDGNIRDALQRDSKDLKTNKSEIIWRTGSILVAKLVSAAMEDEGAVPGGNSAIPNFMFIPPHSVEELGLELFVLRHIHYYTIQSIT